MKRVIIRFAITAILCQTCSRSDSTRVSQSDMESIYNEVKTPFKYGLVVVPPDSSKMLDCPFVFRKDSIWYMTYIIFDGRGYETWIAQSRNLLNWEQSCRILSFPKDSTAWDANQRAGYPALYNLSWGGAYDLLQYNGRFWLSYLGGKNSGYEEGRLAIGLASTSEDPASCHEWECLENPVLTSSDNDVSWWEDLKLYKSTVIEDEAMLTGHKFVMFYNAYGDSLSKGHNAERIGMAVSDDLEHWSRYQKDPVLNHFRGITGDPQITRIGNTYVMFYFGAFWKTDGTDGAFDRFACSYDLKHWTDWTGKNLVEPSEPWDDRYAHKPCIIKWNGTVYHFYCAVNKSNHRGIALATSQDKGKSKLFLFPSN